MVKKYTVQQTPLLMCYWTFFARKAIGLTRKLRFLLILTIHGTWALPAVMVIRLLRPILIIRVGTFRYDRIGHFAADVGHQWAKLHVQPRNIVDWYWLDGPTTNNQWEMMVRRNFSIYSWTKYLDFWNCFIPGGMVHHRPSTTNGSRDIEGLLERAQTKLKFLPSEDVDGKTWLRAQGWQEGEPFVCLLVRDSAYLNSEPKHSKRSWEYHKYRESDIETFIPAAKWLAEQGVWVLRMGKTMARQIPMIHPKVIDYAFHPDKSDFLDVWLFANCDLCITTLSGPDMISDVYRKPILAINFLPLLHLWSWSNVLHHPKKICWKDSGKTLSLIEYLDHSYLTSDQYRDNGIDIVDLKPNEITETVQECWHRIEGKWVVSSDEIEQQKQFFGVLRQSPEFSKYHGWIHPESRLSMSFLRNHHRSRRRNDLSVTL